MFHVDEYTIVFEEESSTSKAKDGYGSVAYRVEVLKAGQSIATGTTGDLHGSLCCGKVPFGGVRSCCLSCVCVCVCVNMNVFVVYRGYVRTCCSFVRAYYCRAFSTGACACAHGGGVVYKTRAHDVTCRRAVIRRVPASERVSSLRTRQCVPLHHRQNSLTRTV
jgi:hypothetical protein